MKLSPHNAFTLVLALALVVFYLGAAFAMLVVRFAMAHFANDPSADRFRAAVESSLDLVSKTGAVFVLMGVFCFAVGVIRHHREYTARQSTNSVSA